MKYLLDTHTLIWALTETNRLSENVRRILANPEHDIVVSTVTFWEISLNIH
jgi:PIN domain nuclease of toxin-antitoxin system